MAENTTVEINRLNKDIKDAQKRIDHIEYEDIKEINQKMNKFEVELNTNDLLVKQSIEANEKLVSTLDSVKSSMVEIAQTVEYQGETFLKQTEVISQLTDKVNSVENKVNNVESKINSVENKFDEVDDEIQRVDNKSKIDIIETQSNSVKTFLSRYGGYIVGGSGIIFAIVELIQKLS